MVEHTEAARIPAARGPESWQRPAGAASVETVGRVHFPPIANGLDYLLSATEHLTQDPVAERALKYAILHLAAGAEVLLKARLQLEHWSLVFKDPGQATRKALESGTLISCTPGEALQRLRDIANVVIGDKDSKTLTQLAQHRNALQHYGLTGPSTEAPAVEARTAAVLDFLIRFLDEELLPALTAGERRAVQGEMTAIRSRLESIASFAKKRMQRLRAELDPVRAHTVRCGECWQFALVIGGPRPRCHFCWNNPSVAYALAHHALIELNRRVVDAAFTDLQTGSLGLGERCDNCGCDTVMHGVMTAAYDDEDGALVALCFFCADVSPTQPTCLGCGRPHDKALNGSLGCPACLLEFRVEQ
ncbi:hypothetical protein OG949_34070 [Streptomyces scopuliridis]|uniref:hypothetical protein n=1 Tax=Streptomyces scopuliridis TaxID=452529 RepID=UPI002DDC2813|nr:hypothetical protein [Streptomyces scopuliridis]WSB37375.1 hypothetical protein OG949_34070 [Streptomyces scopuliridis]